MSQEFQEEFSWVVQAQSLTCNWGQVVTGAGILGELKCQTFVSFYVASGPLHVASPYGLVRATLMALHGALKTAGQLTWQLGAPSKYPKESGKHHIICCDLASEVVHCPSYTVVVWQGSPIQFGEKWCKTVTTRRQGSSGAMARLATIGVIFSELLLPLLENGRDITDEF